MIAAPLVHSPRRNEKNARDPWQISGRNSAVRDTSRIIDRPASFRRSRTFISPEIERFYRRCVGNIGQIETNEKRGRCSPGFFTPSLDPPRTSAPWLMRSSFSIHHFLTWPTFIQPFIAPANLSARASHRPTVSCQAPPLSPPPPIPIRLNLVQNTSDEQFLFLSILRWIVQRGKETPPDSFGRAPSSSPRDFPRYFFDLELHCGTRENPLTFSARRTDTRNYQKRWKLDRFIIPLLEILQT